VAIPHLLWWSSTTSVVGDDAAGVADDVRLAVAEAQHAVDVEPGVHAGDDGDVAGRRPGQPAPGERCGERLVGGDQLVGDGHASSSVCGEADLPGRRGPRPSA
jgi:hypothetical protein